jgi:CheY-like chemotaxis protein
VIRIIDTGMGMDEQTQKRIFEPFFTTKEVGKGTGLGLAGAYGCIRNHNGSINVSSKPGQGSVFTTMLPLAEAEIQDVEKPLDRDAPPRGSGHILIVDDEESVRNFVWTALEHMGYTVAACQDGAAGLEYFREHHKEIDLVILDLIMPKMSGQDAFKEMKKIDPNVKVLVSSGFSRTQTTNQLLNEGALAILNKPFQISQLAETVAKHIRHNSH